MEIGHDETWLDAIVVQHLEDRLPEMFEGRKAFKVADVRAGHQILTRNHADRRFEFAA